MAAMMRCEDSYFKLFFENQLKSDFNVFGVTLTGNDAKGLWIFAIN